VPLSDYICVWNSLKLWRYFSYKNEIIVYWCVCFVIFSCRCHVTFTTFKFLSSVIHFTSTGIWPNLHPLLCEVSPKIHNWA
jgi:hypothetical protein